MNNLQPVENEGQRVLTTAQLAELYEADIKVISNNFNRNKTRYVGGKHYYYLTGDALKEFKTIHQFDEQFKHTTALYLWTEKGALLHAKSLNTDKAWAVYDELVETYFRAKQTPQLSSIELIASIANNAVEMERRQKQLEAKQAVQEAAIADTNQRLDGIRDVISLDKNSWRQDTKNLISKIAETTGSGHDTMCDVYKEVYKLVESRAGVSLKTRQTNKRRRMAEEGVCKSKRDKVSKVDIIAEDKKLIEIFIAIVKEMAIKYGVCK